MPSGSVLAHFFVVSIPIVPRPFALILGIVCLLAGPSLGLVGVANHVRIPNNH
jgi:hypothetical protein